MKTIAAVLATAILCGLCGLSCRVTLSSATQPQDYPADYPKSAAYILVESSTGQVLSEHNADERLASASLTKIMVLLLVADELNAGRLTITEDVAVSSHASSMDGSVIWLEPGETMSVGDLIKSVVMASANDAAVALAERVAGSETEFVRLMNQKAHVLGMTNTNFTNAVGFDNPNHYTTARDVAVMSRALMRDNNYKHFAEHMLTRLCYVRTGTEREAQLLNTNKMITFYNGIEGIKTGTTDNAGYCLSAAATRNGMRLISVVMGCEGDTAKIAEYNRVDLTEKLLDYGFARYEVRRDISDVLRSEHGFGSYAAFGEYRNSKRVSLSGSAETDIEVMPMLPESIVVPRGRARGTVYDVYLPEKLTAPLAAGQPVGIVTATLDGELLFECYIVTLKAAEKLTFWKVLSVIVRGFFM